MGRTNDGLHAAWQAPHTEAGADDAPAFQKAFEFVQSLAAELSKGRVDLPAYSPDGRRVYVSIWDQARTVAAVGVLDTATNQFLATIPVRTRPYLSAVTPDGQRLYVPNHDSGTVSVIDTATRGRVSLTTPSARLVIPTPAHNALKFRAPTVRGPVD